MKIKTFLMTAEEKKMVIREVVRENPAMAEILEATLSTSDYVELETSAFDDQPLEAQEYFRKGFAIYFKNFANKLLAAISFDLAVYARGDNGMPGMQVIERGLKEMDDGLAVVDIVLSTNPSLNPNYS